MTEQQEKAVRILNKVRDYMKEELSEDDYMYLLDVIFNGSSILTDIYGKLSDVYKIVSTPYQFVETSPKPMEVWYKTNGVEKTIPTT